MVYTINFGFQNWYIPLIPAPKWYIPVYTYKLDRQKSNEEIVASLGDDGACLVDYGPLLLNYSAFFTSKLFVLAGVSQKCNEEIKTPGIDIASIPFDSREFLAFYYHNRIKKGETLSKQTTTQSRPSKTDI